MEASTDKKTGIWAKRDVLKNFSAQVAELVEDGKYSNINEAIIEEIYRNAEHREFNTYRQWKEKGFQVRKGETAFFVWAKPLDVQKDKSETTPEEQEEKSRFYPLCFLFSNAQVDSINPV